MLKLHMGKTHVIIRFGFLLQLSLFLLLDQFGLGLAFLEAVLLHEGGHLLVLLLRHCPVEELELSLFGISIRQGREASLPPAWELALYLAGPAANLMMLAVFYPYDKFRAVFHLLLAALNLLPLRPMDGGNALFLLLETFFDLPAAERFCERTERVGAVLLLIGGLWLLLKQLNPSLLVFTLFLTMQGKRC